MRGLFLSFEGSEGCGKSTQIRLLIEWLTAHHRDVLMVREPGGTPVGEKVRHLLQHDSDAGAMTAETELLLFAASRAQLVREVILPALEQDRIVVADRFLDSTTVYQGIGRRLPTAEVRAINRFAAGSHLPHLTFLLDMDAREAMHRVHAARGADGGLDRIEDQPIAFFEDVRRGYLEIAASEPHRIKVLDASQPEAVIASQIQLALAATRHALLEGIGA
jgi:dTMP kinase